MTIAHAMQSTVSYQKYLLIIVLLSISSSFAHAEECYPKARKALVDIGQQFQQSIKQNDVDAVKRLFDLLVQHDDIKDCQSIQGEVLSMTKQRKKILTSMQKSSSDNAAPSDRLKSSYVKAEAVHNAIQQALQNKSTEKIDTDLEEFNLHEPSSNCALEAEKRIRLSNDDQEIAFSSHGTSLTLAEVLTTCEALLQAKTDLIVPIYQHNEATRKGARKQELASWQESYVHGIAQQKVFADEKMYIPKLKKSDGQITWQYKSSTTARSSDKNYIADTDISVTTEIETRTTQCTDYTFSSDGKQLINKKVYGCTW